jgi:hypothetical protein
MFNRSHSQEIVVFILFSCFLFSICSSNNDGNQAYEKQENIQNSKPKETKTINSQEKSPFVCDYLGQELSGDIPVKFAPGIVSTDDDDS